MEELRLHLDGPAHGIDARALREGLDGLLRLITTVGALDGELASEVWVLSELSLSSLDCAVTALPEFEVLGRARFSTVWSGAQHLTGSAGIPEGWSEQTLQAVVDLVELTKFRGVEGARLSRNSADAVRLDAALKTNAELSLSTARESLSEARGEIVRYVNDGKRRETSIRDRPAGRSLRVSFPMHLDRPILEALISHSRVSVWGMLKRNSQGQKLSLRLMQNPVSDWPAVVGPKSWRHAASNNRQRLLRPIERR